MRGSILHRLGAIGALAANALLPRLPAQDLSPAVPTAVSAAHGQRPLRLGVVQWLRPSREEEESLVPPTYSNHMPKSLVYETLVGVDASGRPQPALAQAWEIDADGLRYVFRLRPTATFHDGSPVTAAAVKRYFESFLVRDVDRFIGACERITRLEVLDPHTLAIHLDRRHAILGDLALINPMAVVGGPVERGKEWPLIGSGPWRVLQHEPMRRTSFARHDGFDGAKPKSASFEWIALLAGADRDPVATWALERGHVDAVVESWRPSIARDQALELVAAGKATMLRGEGAMVQLLCFNHLSGPFSRREWRRVVRDVVDREALLRVVEHGFGRVCTTPFPPEIADWPDQAERIDLPTSSAVGEAATPRAERVEAECLVVSSDPAQFALAVELARQLRPHGIELRFASVTQREHNRRVKDGEFDLYVTRTWGPPYDPQATLRARFRAETRQARNVFYADPELVPLIDAAAELEAGPERATIYAKVQHLLDERIAVLPLFIPDRIALLGPHVEGLQLGSVIYGIDLKDLQWRP